MEEELDWSGEDEQGQDGQEAAAHGDAGHEEGVDGLRGDGGHAGSIEPAAEEPQQQLERAGSMTPTASPVREAANGAAAGAAAATVAAAAALAAAGAGDTVPDEWQVMDVPEEWRPRPMVRVWGLPVASTEEEVTELLEGQLAVLGHSVRSVVFDPRQTTAAGKVALVRFRAPPMPEEAAPTSGEGEGGSSAPPKEADAGKVAEAIIAALRAAAPELHGVKINVEKTGAEVCLFLANLRSEMESDEALHAKCSEYGTLERCFVMRNPAGDSKGYGFAEFTLPACAAACKEAWNKAREAQLPPRDASGKPVRVKLQRAEAAPVKTASGLFSASLFVDGLRMPFSKVDSLKQLFGEYGEVTTVYLPRSPNNPEMARGFAFVHFKNSFAADAAYRALDGTEHENIGRLLISFSNPVKASEPHFRPASAAAGSQRPQQQSQQQSQQQQRAQPQQRSERASSQQGQQGQRGAAAAGPRDRSVHVGGSAGASWQRGGQSSQSAAPIMSMAGMGPIILPASGQPQPPPGNPPPSAAVAAATLQQQQRVAIAQQQQQAMGAMQQMMMMQQAAAMQQAMMQQAAAAAAEMRRKQEEEAVAKAAAEAERKRKQEEDEKKRREAEYAARLGYGGFGAMPAAGGLGGMPAVSGMAGLPAAMAGMPAAMAGMGGMAGFMNPAAMAAMASAAGLAGLPGMAGYASGLGVTAGGSGAAAGGTAGAAAGGAAGGEASPRGGGRGRARVDDDYAPYSSTGRDGGPYSTSGRDGGASYGARGGAVDPYSTTGTGSGYGGSGGYDRAGSGYADDAGDDYGGGGYGGYGGAGSGRRSGYAGGGGSEYGSGAGRSGYGGGGSEYGGAGGQSGYGGSGGDDYGSAGGRSGYGGDEYGRSGYGGSGGDHGGGGSSRDGGYGGSKRDNDGYQGGYGDTYSYPPKRPRY